ncbi:glycoside hydrolase family 32 protein [Paenibacillus sp. CF384]|uniref:glycoside hydrolase family 32 protein n=1 Tax=Paenibacillus sp. CF384 TaxID=1884382 RepID=UPI0008951E40|nr:glycoside hydrolase family 32 protein [Paenibacillus sp. CF384]SDX06558.1 fructan beta-fructosidase [Paenibacillus sp. CF384]
MDKFRPKYHFTPERNWMNDPNGMVFFNGEYHLFYQHHPHSALPGPMHWGHAISSDMVNWEHCPIALYPDENGVIFSGSAVVDWEDTSGFFGGKPGLVAIFTHHDRMPGMDRVRERQSLAYSLDSGRSWIKYSDNPVLESDRFVDFRDPKVFWHSDSKRWVMILASGQSVCLYHSDNLKEWTFSSEFGHGNGSHDGVWECPDLFALPVDGDPSRMKWVMIVSIGRPEQGTMTQYFIGEFDGHSFVNDNPADVVLRLDHGSDNYAGVSWSDVPEEDGRRNYIAWMSNGKYAIVTPTDEWRSAMTVPRTLTLESRHNQIRLIQNPVRELEQIRISILSLEETSIEEAQLHIAGLELDSFEMIAEFVPGMTKALTIKVRASDSQQTVIGYEANQNEIYVDRTRSGIIDFHKGFAGIHAVKLATATESIKLHIFVDRSSVEVFVNDGIAVITDLIFPEPGATGLELSASEAGMRLRRFELFKLG